MSNRDSLGFGDMVPQDVVDIFAHEKPGKIGRKKRSRSLGRALGWLKGKRRKAHESNRHGLSPSLDLAVDLNPAGHKGGPRSGKQAHGTGNSHGIPKRDDDDDKTLAPPTFQENVFESSSSSRPKYLEDLHTEALEGLKLMQQEETSTGVEYKDNESTISTMSVQTDGECGGFMTDSTIPDTTSVVSMQSSVSTKSSRSGLTRQGSTFRPLNSGKTSKSRRRHRRTVAGIPQHVQKELGLDRVGWTMSKRMEEEQHYNGESDYSSTTEGPESPDGPTTGLQAMNVIHPLSKDRVELFASGHTGLKDDLGLRHTLDPQKSQSLAAHWVNSGSSIQQEPPSPVMSMSPQAAYMSKIIPNAVLPPSIDVVEISRGRSRNSVRTVSKSSLVLSSPAPSRASSRASSTKTTSSKASTITSRHNKPSLSESNWSNSDSSDTLVSNSSTISTSSTPRQRRCQDGDVQEEKISLHSNGKPRIPGDDAKKDGQFGRSVSIMKPKRAPPPPSRSYSLHTKMKRRSRDLAEVNISRGEPISAPCEQKENNKHGSSPVSTSPGYNADTSSLGDSMESVSSSPKTFMPQVQKRNVATTETKKVLYGENKLNNMISQSSGYSSRETSSSRLPKKSLNSSPKPKKGIFAKLQRLFPGSSPSASFSVGQAETPENTKYASVDTAIVSPSVQALRELFNIPRHPKVHAPPPPPPEVWAHSKRSFELLLGPPAPENLYAIIKKNPKDRRQQRQYPSASADGSVRNLVGERKQHAMVVECVGAVDVQNTKKVQESGIVIAETERLVENVVLKENCKEEKVRGSDVLNGMLAKAVEKRKENLAAKREELKMSTQPTDTTRVHTISAISLVHSSPSQSPSLGQRIVQTPATQTTTSRVVVSPESSWPPPPPPPMAQVSPGGPEDLNFPLPPPPLFAEGMPVLPVQVPPNAEAQKLGTSQENGPPPLNIPPPPPYTAPPPPVTTVPNTTISIIPHSLPVIQEVITPPPVEVLTVRPKDSSAPVLHGAIPFLQDVASTQVTMVTPPGKNVNEVSLLPPESIPPPPPEIYTTQRTAEVKGVGKITPPQSIPPPPPLPSQKQPSDLVIETSSHLAPPKSIPPPPPVEHFLHAQIIGMKTKDPATNHIVDSPEKSPESPDSSVPSVQEEPTPIVTPSLLQMVKLRSVNSSPESPKKEQPQAEVILRKHLPSNIKISSPSGEAPQKPIRRSLIVLSPTSASPPTTVTSQLPPPKYVTSTVSPATVESTVEKSTCIPTEAASSVVPPASMSTVTCPVETCPPVTLAAPSVAAPPETSATDASEEKTAATPVNPASASVVVSSMENSPPDASIVPSIDDSTTFTVLSVENVPTETAGSLSIEVLATPTDVSSIENVPTKEASSPSIEVSATPLVVATVETVPPEMTSTSSIEVPATPTVVSSVENVAPGTTVGPCIEVSAPSSVDSLEISSSVPPAAATAAPTDAPTAGPNAVPMIQAVITSPPAISPAPTVVFSTAPTSSVIVTVSKSSSASTAAPASSYTVTSSSAEKSPATAVVPPIVVSPTPTTAVGSPVKKSPGASATPSMNLQEAIRLRTAARSKEAPASRLSLHSPTSPKDFQKSPTSTASFIFSKTNKKMVIETKTETDGEVKKSPALSPFVKAVSEAEALKKGVKVPPPVAKKPKSKGNEAESSDTTLVDAGQRAQQETEKDIAEKTNGTAGTVEGEGST